ncbi:hypothetical protein EDC01DRAFT_788972 [Geopyxis carbonaria]|nr:hypothetical protein EDC01DRAFT_788972 [Geopyxis carbonaria]
MVATRSKRSAAGTEAGTGAKRQRTTTTSRNAAASQAPRIPAASSSKATTSIARSSSTASLTSLPYHLLLSIALHTATGSNSSYLLSLATVCHTFTDAALAALYNTPPLSPPSRAFALHTHLQTHPHLGHLIKSLHLPVEPLLSKRGAGRFDLAAFLSAAPGVREIRFTHESEHPPYRSAAAVWAYPDAVWDALAPRRLHSWRWNGEFAASMKPEKVAEVMRMPCFQSLRRLSVVNADQLPGFAPELLKLLPELQELEVESSPNVDAAFLAAVPTAAPALRLTRLALINCASLTASALHDFLLSPPCHTLQSLSVQHSRATSLAFLPALASTPQLRSIDFDGLYFSTANFYRDTEPLYPSLLPAGVAPHWPAALQEVRLRNMRKWEHTECAVLLKSLVEAELPGLRKVQVHCIIPDLGWRERARFREGWEERIVARFVAAEAGAVHKPKPQQKQKQVEVEVEEDTSPRTRRRARAELQDEAETETPVPAPLYRGTCGRSDVEVKFDNIRPMERQYDASDFLDVERRRGRARVLGRGGARKRGNGGRRGRGRVVVVDVEGSEGDEEYVE